MQQYFLPISLRINDLHVLVVGGGQIAWRKIQTLLGKVASITVVAPKMHVEILQCPNISLIPKPYEPKYLIGKDLLIVATGEVDLALRIFQDLKDHPHILSNFADYPDYSDFYSMATLDHKGFTIAISSGGENPEGVKKLKEELKGLLR